MTGRPEHSSHRKMNLHSILNDEAANAAAKDEGQQRRDGPPRPSLQDLERINRPLSGAPMAPVAPMTPWTSAPSTPQLTRTNSHASTSSGPATPVMSMQPEHAWAQTGPGILMQLPIYHHSGIMSPDQSYALVSHPPGVPPMLILDGANSYFGAPVTKKGKNSYPCPVSEKYACTDMFTTSGHAARHAKKHTGEKNAICPDCQKAFTRKDNMEQHRRTHRRHEEKAREARVKKRTSPQPITNHSAIQAAVRPAPMEPMVLPRQAPTRYAAPYGYPNLQAAPPVPAPAPLLPSAAAPLPENAMHLPSRPGPLPSPGHAQDRRPQLGRLETLAHVAAGTYDPR